MYSPSPIFIDNHNISEQKLKIKDAFHSTYSQYEDLFDSIDEAAMYMQPDPLRQPLLFYLAHTSVFYINKLILSQSITKRVNKNFESFFAVGVDEMSWDDVRSCNTDQWPQVSEIKSYRSKVREVVSQFIDRVTVEKVISWNSPMWIILMGIEHERIHLETSSVLIRQLPINKIKNNHSWLECSEIDDDYPVNELLEVSKRSIIRDKSIQNTKQYGWDNEYGFHKSTVGEFKASKYLVSNGEFRKFVDSNGYQNKEYWDVEGWDWRTKMQVSCPKFWLSEKPGDYKLRTIFREISMPWSWPVEVNFYEAKAFCNYLSHEQKIKIRLPTEDEWFSLREEYETTLTADSKQPHGNINLQHYSSPCPVHKFSFDRFYDISGNVWQWTETSIYPFEGFEPHPMYDDFTIPTFDSLHNLIKGGSFISTGNLSNSDSRYAFRKHFFQHAGFRYVKSNNNESYEKNTKDGNNLYNLDEIVMQYIDMHYGQEYFNVPNYPKHCIDNIIDILGKNSFNRTLDLGCSVGRSSFELAKYSHYVKGIDLSARFIQVATLLQEKGQASYSIRKEGDIKSYKKAILDQDSLCHVNKIKFMQGDACNLSDADKNMDLIFAGNLIDRLNNPIMFLENIHAYLVIGGHLAISSPYTWLEEYTKKSNWLGGIRNKNGDFIDTYQGIANILDKNFKIVGTSQDIPFVIRETARKYQHSIAQFTLWKRVK
jgi:5-histidylcysteine sulfoxide synthase/putative 4-mercaptohistidine N1-methyltranferase